VSHFLFCQGPPNIVSDLHRTVHLFALPTPNRMVGRKPKEVGHLSLEKSDLSLEPS
jgi:hypothetical protein